MNVNEVLAKPRAGDSGAGRMGSTRACPPLDDINLHQSTNDMYPTALRLAAIRLLHELETNVVALQESFQRAERRFCACGEGGADRVSGCGADHAGGAR